MKYLPKKTNDGVDTLYSTEFQETFHSMHGALAETKHVFLRGTGIEQRLEQGLPSRILEVGFGAALNFLATAQLSRAAQVPLHYVALEKELLPGEVLENLNHGQLFDEKSEIRSTFLDWRRDLPTNLPSARLRWQVEEIIWLDLLLGDATEIDIPNLAYHAIYHDAFSPKSNPELWTEDFFARLYAVLGEDGKLATYSAKAAVRRTMQAVGFRVEKQPGAPGKREMLVATRRGVF